MKPIWAFLKYKIIHGTHETKYKKFLHFFSYNIKMSLKNINFNDKKINKSNFYKNKKLFDIDNIDADKILISKKEPHGTNNSYKYYIGYNDNDNIIPLLIKFPQMIGYAKYFESNKTMSFKIDDQKIIKKIH